MRLAAVRYNVESREPAACLQHTTDLAVEPATLFAALGATLAYATDIGYLAPPGVPAKEFPSPQRPVAQIVSPSRSAEEHRDSLNEAGDIARLLELKLGMTVGDIGAGSGYHTVRLSRLVGPAGSVIKPARHTRALLLLFLCLGARKLAAEH
jgi:hypothetical protein